MKNPSQMSNLELFGVGTAIGGVAGLGLVLLANWAVKNMFATAPMQPSAANPQITNPTPITSPPVQPAQPVPATVGV